ncbi:unnamed protein product [Bathycoccus prasinos]
MTTASLPSSSFPEGKGKSGYDAANDAAKTRAQQEAARGKGAWDCEKYCEILPEDEARVFEEIATANEGDFVFEGIPCVQPRTDYAHLAFFFDGCRYRIKADVKEKCQDIKKRLWEKGCGKGEPMITGRRRTVEDWRELTLLYSCEIIPEDTTLLDFGVPPGCKCLIAIETAILESGKPSASDPYWN